MSRTLIVHTGGIGDFILTLPAISILSGETQIELAGYRDRLELAVAGGIAKAARSLDTIQFHTLFTTPSDTLRAFASQFDRAIVFMRDPDGAIREGLLACGISQVETHPGLPDADWSRYATDYYADRLHVTAPADFRVNVAPAGDPLDVVIHPGSGSPKKNWPMTNFVALAESLKEAGRQVTWCLGPAETAGESPPTTSANLLQCDSLTELAQRLVSAKLYIGNDSGITHLAAALDLPTIAIFGPTDPAFWAPRSAHVQVLRREAWPTVEEVLSATNRRNEVRTLTK